MAPMLLSYWTVLCCVHSASLLQVELEPRLALFYTLLCDIYFQRYDNGFLVTVECIILQGRREEGSELGSE